MCAVCRPSRLLKTQNAIARRPQDTHARPVYYPTVARFVPWVAPRLPRPIGRMNWFILVLSTTTSEGHQTSGRSPPTSRWTKSTTGYAGFGLSAVISPPPLHLARAAIFTIAPRASQTTRPNNFDPTHRPPLTGIECLGERESGREQDGRSHLRWLARVGTVVVQHTARLRSGPVSQGDLISRDSISGD